MKLNEMCHYWGWKSNWDELKGYIYSVLEIRQSSVCRKVLKDEQLHALPVRTLFVKVWNFMTFMTIESTEKWNTKFV